VANEEQLAILKQGVEVWNKWREDNPDEKIDLSYADLSTHYSKLLPPDSVDDPLIDSADDPLIDSANDPFIDSLDSFIDSADAPLIDSTDDPFIDSLDPFGTEGDVGQPSDICLSGANLSGADLKYANFSFTDLSRANLQEADLCHSTMVATNLSRARLDSALLCEANLQGANLAYADLAAAHLGNANLSHASLDWANLQWSILESANLTSARLLFANLVSANLKNAVLIDCNVHGSSVWGVNLEHAKQLNLIITNYGESAITVDSLEVAQFVYLLLNNDKVRNVLDTIGKKGVLILGRFSPERKQVLDALRDKLRTLDFVPMMFDFEGASTKDFTETVKVLAGMCRFIIADITSPKSSPLELQATVPDYKVPFVPIIQEGEEPFSMFANLQSYPWMFDILQYKDSDQLLAVIDKAIIQPALIKADELNVQKAEEVRKRHAEDYL